MSIAIETGRLRLRPLIMDDAAPLAALVDNWKVARMLTRVPHPNSVADTQAFIATVQVRPPRPGHACMAITLADAPVGVVSVETRGARPELGFWLGEPHWGHGYVSEAASALTGWFFSTSAEESLASGAIADNHASLRIQEKLGFEPVGFGRVFSRARGRDVPHVATLLTRAHHETGRIR